MRITIPVIERWKEEDQFKASLEFKGSQANKTAIYLKLFVLIMYLAVSLAHVSIELVTSSISKNSILWYFIVITVTNIPTTTMACISLYIFLYVVNWLLEPEAWDCQ